METNDKKGMARREFLKRLGGGTAAPAPRWRAPPLPPH